MDDRKLVVEVRMNQPASIFNVRIDNCSAQTLLRTILAQVKQNHKVIIANVNIFALNLTFDRPWLRSFFNQAHLVFCDGAGVKLASCLLGFVIPQRITYADWMWQLAEFCAENSLRLYFLGSRPGIAEKASDQLKTRYPSMEIVGIHDGYFDKTVGSVANSSVINQINAVKPDILIVGFGMPLQEHWLMENWQNIDAHVFLTGGAVFDYISGELPRAPRWMTDHGLEWLGRLIIEPRRLWKRYLIGIPLFFWRVLLQKFGLKQFPIEPQPPDESLNESVISRER